ncbi:MAG: DNA primase large subunit PriL [Candidatus Bathyarchaeota archaeon]
MQETTEYIKSLNLNIDELNSPDYLDFIQKSEKRLEEALKDGSVRPPNLKDERALEIEILSFPIAIFLIVKIDDNYLKKRYAEAEAKRAYGLLKNDEDNKIIEIAKTTFGWKAKIKENKFFLYFIDYLRNSTSGALNNEDRWKLINQIMIDGEVRLEKEKFARLLMEEIQKRIEAIIDKSPKTVKLGASLSPIVERIQHTLSLQRKNTQMHTLPKNAVSAAYPPCIKKLYDSLISSEHISHMGRFTLTSFLLTAGMNTDDLIKIYTSSSDFNHEQTRYQIEHIAGGKGSRIKYKPPFCSTLKTHNLCFNMDELCTKIRHPLTYYSRKLELLQGHSE